MSNKKTKQQKSPAVIGKALCCNINFLFLKILRKTEQQSYASYRKGGNPCDNALSDYDNC